MDGDEGREELERRRALARRMGGPEAVERQHRAGKLSARERIDLLLDAGSFRELGTLTGRATHGAGGALGDLVPANALIGTGTIDGRKVAVSADDFTIRGGSSESTVAEKWIYAERLALELRMPLLRLVDSAGGSVRLLEQQQHTRIPGYPSWPLMPLLAAVPVVGVALGSCAGLGAIKVAGSHFSIMARGTSQVFAAGPPVVKQAFNVDVDKEGLGGYRVHTRKSGVVDNEAADEPDALRQARRFLGYLPRHVWELAPVAPCADPAGRAEEWLKDAIPPDRRKLYDPRRILEGVLDRESIFEIGRYHGGSTITCLARLGGIPDPRAGRLAGLADELVRRSLWIVGGDGWAYDIGSSGLDHVLASGRNVNVLVLDTQVYSNTGGQASKATPRGAVAKFAAGGKGVARKDLGQIASAYGNVYVAQVAMGADDAQSVKALLEADAWQGPSLVIAYSTCIAHGIEMSRSMAHQRDAVRSGFWPLYRFHPGTDPHRHPFHLDSRKPSIPLRDFALREARFAILERVDPERAHHLLALAQADADERWRFYEQLTRMERTLPHEEEG